MDRLQSVLQIASRMQTKKTLVRGVVEFRWLDGTVDYGVGWGTTEYGIAADALRRLDYSEALIVKCLDDWHVIEQEAA